MLPPQEQGDGDRKAAELAKRWAERIKHFQRAEDQRKKRWEECRKYADGNPHDDGRDGLVRVNLVQSVLQTIQPSIYARSPDVIVSPAERIDTETRPADKTFARALEIVLRGEAIRRPGLKQRGKASVRASLTCTTGWLWVYYETGNPPEPITESGPNDLTDNAARAQTLAMEQEEAFDEARAQTQQHLSAAIAKEPEIRVSEGIVYDQVSPEDCLIMDESVRCIDDYRRSAAIARRVRMTVARYRDLFGKEPPKLAKRYNLDDGKSDDADCQLVDVWEIWAHQDLTVYTLPDGCNEWAREPFSPENLGETWYPCFPLQLSRVDNVLYPRSTVENLIELVDEYNTRRTKSRKHRDKIKPIRVFNKASGVTDDELRAINEADDDTVAVGVSARPDESLRDQIAELEPLRYDATVYDTSDILRDIEMVSGAQDAARGGMVNAKTATEAEIMRQGNQSRSAEAIDMVEDWMTDILTYAAQLILQNMDPQRIAKRYGERVAQAWPALTKEDIFTRVNITLRAGSMAATNRLRERDQWMQLIPLLQTAVTSYIEAKRAGDTLATGAIEAIADETLRRFDERVSFTDLIGGGDPFAPEQTDPVAEQQAQMESMRQQVAATFEEQIAAAQQAIQAKEDELSQREQAISGEASKLEQAKRDIAAEVERQSARMEGQAAQIEGKAASVKAAEDALMFKIREIDARDSMDRGDAEQAAADGEERRASDAEFRSAVVQALASISQRQDGGQDGIAAVLEELKRLAAITAAKRRVTDADGNTVISEPIIEHHADH